MIRAFVALPLPPALSGALEDAAADLPPCRIVATHNMHLTLAFLGAQPTPVLEELHLALAALRLPGFDLLPDGPGTFGGARPHSLHLRIRPTPPLVHLHRRVTAAARGAGIDLPGRRFVPHVTLARLGPGRGADPGALARALEALPLPRAPVPVDAFALWRSDLHRGGAEYTEMARYGLLPPAAGPDADTDAAATPDRDDRV